MFGNVFGLMPLKNFWARNTVFVKFTIHSWNFWYSITIQLCIFTFVFTSFYKQFVYRVEFDKISKFLIARSSTFSLSFKTKICSSFIVNFLSFTSSLLVYFNFVLVAKRWKDLQQFWEHTEWLLAGQTSAGYNKKVLQRKIYVIASVILGVAIRE